MYNIEFRKAVLEFGEKENLSSRKLAKHFNVPLPTIANWKKRLEPSSVISFRSPVSKELLWEDVNTYPLASLRERAERFGISHRTIRKSLILYEIPYAEIKKKHKIPNLVKCIRCNHDKCSKQGFGPNGKQRYKCLLCKYRFAEGEVVKEKRECPHSHSEKYGIVNNKQRFRCLACKRLFMEE